MLTPLTILSARQGPAYDERAALTFAGRLARLVAWNGVLFAQLHHAKQRLHVAARLHRLDVGWRDVMLNYRLAAEG